jgi:hypothetical protein
LNWRRLASVLAAAIVFVGVPVESARGCSRVHEDAPDVPDGGGGYNGPAPSFSGAPALPQQTVNPYAPPPG